MYRPELKVLDCTIRDGGLMNKWQFSKEMVRDVFDGLARAGVDYIELGYRASKDQFDPAEYGPWRFCEEQDLRDVAYECDSKVSVMLDVGRSKVEDIVPAAESIVGMYRVAVYVQDIEEAIGMAEHVKALGYETCVNIMAVSHALEPELDAALDRLQETTCDVVYLVDSFGYFTSETTHYLAEKYLTRLKGKQVGIHTHNNQQLGFANTVEAVLKGINYLDGSIYGIGRGAGNCPLELLIGYLKNPRFDPRPVYDLIEKYFIGLKHDLRWGYEIPYVISGILNKHPKAAMAFIEEPTDLSFGQFYDQLLNVDDA